MNNLFSKITIILIASLSASNLLAESKNNEFNSKQCVRNANQHKANAEKAQRITHTPYPDAVYLEADTGNIKTIGTSLLQGNVIIQQNRFQFNADTASYDRERFLVNAQGNVVFSTADNTFKSDAIHYNLRDKTGTIQNAEYAVGADSARGKSKKIELIDQNNIVLKNATFTTCPAPVNSWHLASSTISLNNKTHIGSARNVTMNVSNIPVFYFPWLNFPINNQRMSGFLSPSFRFQSDAGISIPYYLNLAPNYDATLTLVTHSSHGLELQSEFRYLTEDHQGKLAYNILPNDKGYGKENRDYFKIDHLTSLSQNTKVSITAEGVSDNDYFDDFSGSLEGSSRSALKRRLELKSTFSPWTVTAAVEDFQILDVTNAPYARLPEITLKYAPKTAPHDLKLGLDAEVVYFEKDATVPVPTGSRADIKLSASKKWGNDAWFFKPSVGLEHTLYNLNHATKSSINRTLPTLTLDGGFFFDREVSLGKKKSKYTQTLEPRIFYAYTPFKDQSDIPIFDTSLKHFSVTTELFSANRFTGKDRIADNNQLTVALTSRLQDRNTGKEVFTASIGQVLNFDDRRVILPSGAISTGKNSDLVLALAGRLNENFRLSTTTVFSSEKNRSSSYELRLNYQDKKKRIANMRFRKLDTELKQLSVSTSLPLNDKWAMVAHTNHDLKNHRSLESLLGFEYQDCCWKVRVVAKHYLSNDNRNYETPIFFEFELKGLGNLGSGASREIKDKIYGYDNY